MPLFKCDYTDNQTLVMVVKTIWRDATPVTPAQVAEYLKGAAPIVECPVSKETWHAYLAPEIIAYPGTPEGRNMAELLAAQLIICAAGLWPTPAPQGQALMAGEPVPVFRFSVTIPSTEKDEVIAGNHLRYTVVRLRRDGTYSTRTMVSEWNSADDPADLARELHMCRTLHPRYTFVVYDRKDKRRVDVPPLHTT